LSTIFPKNILDSFIVPWNCPQCRVVGNNGLCTVLTKEGGSVNFQSVIALLHQYFALYKRKYHSLVFKEDNLIRRLSRDNGTKTGA
jgi:hypothetical protein